MMISSSANTFQQLPWLKKALKNFHFFPFFSLLSFFDSFFLWSAFWFRAQNTLSLSHDHFWWKIKRDWRNEALLPRLAVFDELSRRWDPRSSGKATTATATAVVGGVVQPPTALGAAVRGQRDCDFAWLVALIPYMAVLVSYLMPKAFFCKMLNLRLIFWRINTTTRCCRDAKKMAKSLRITNLSHKDTHKKLTMWGRISSSTFFFCTKDFAKSC